MRAGQKVCGKSVGQADMGETGLAVLSASHSPVAECWSGWPACQCPWGRCRGRVAQTHPLEGGRGALSLKAESARLVIHSSTDCVLIPELEPRQPCSLGDPPCPLCEELPCVQAEAQRAGCGIPCP